MLAQILGLFLIAQPIQAGTADNYSPSNIPPATQYLHTDALDPRLYLQGSGFYLPGGGEPPEDPKLGYQGPETRPTFSSCQGAGNARFC